MRNSSLVEQACADNVTGLSVVPKLRDSAVKCTVGRGAFHGPEKVYLRGALEGMEERMQAQVTKRRVRSPSAENLRFPG